MTSVRTNGSLTRCHVRGKQPIRDQVETKGLAGMKPFLLKLFSWYCQPSTPVSHSLGLSQTLLGHSPGRQYTSPGYHNYHWGLHGFIPPTPGNNWLSLAGYLFSGMLISQSPLCCSDGIKSLYSYYYFGEASIKLVHYAGDADTMLIPTLQLPSWPSQ